MRFEHVLVRDDGGALAGAGADVAGDLPPAMVLPAFASFSLPPV